MARPIPMSSSQTFASGKARTLEQAVHAAVAAVEDGALTRLSPNDPPPFTHARAVLSLLAICYARQIYSSSDLADIARRDAEFPRVWGEDYPDAEALRRFRSENRSALHHCLAAALRFGVGQKISLGIVTKVNDTQLAEEANRRIVMAMMMDNVEMDGEHVPIPPVEFSYLIAKPAALVV